MKIAQEKGMDVNDHLGHEPKRVKRIRRKARSGAVVLRILDENSAAMELLTGQFGDCPTQREVNTTR